MAMMKTDKAMQASGLWAGLSVLWLNRSMVSNYTHTHAHEVFLALILEIPLEFSLYTNELFSFALSFDNNRSQTNSHRK